MENKIPKKRGRPKKVKTLPDIPFSFPKKPGGLRGIVNTGMIFIGDAGFFADDPQKHDEGIIENDPTNPFKDWDRFRATHENDCALDLPGSFNGDLPGRGVVIQTHMMGGTYAIEKEVCPSSGKLLSLKVVFRD